jgi:ketosteroid isomerase-like protein
VPEENVEIVRRAVDAFVANDFEAWFGVADPAIRLYPRAEEPGVKACYEGWDEMLDYLVNWYSGWEDYTADAERFLDAGDFVVVDMREVGVAEGSGIRIEENFAHAFRIDGGKIVEWRMYGPLEEALDAVRAMESSRRT